MVLYDNSLLDRDNAWIKKLVNLEEEKRFFAPGFAIGYFPLAVPG